MVVVDEYVKDDRSTTPVPTGEKRREVLLFCNFVHSLPSRDPCPSAVSAVGATHVTVFRR